MRAAASSGGAIGTAGNSYFVMVAAPAGGTGALVHIPGDGAKFLAANKSALVGKTTVDILVAQWTETTAPTLTLNGQALP
jgi:hypothetical protein